MSVKVAEIEQQLREIWKGFSKKDQKEQAVTRAQVMNLIVYSSDKNADAEISQVLADVSEESPGRMIVLIQDSDLSPSVMNSWVNALCHVSSGGRRQVCSEQIMIHAGDRDVHQWSSVVLPLLVPDLSTFLWWHDKPDSDIGLLNAIAEVCDRVVLDSSSFADLSIIPQLMKTHGEWLSISDLNWARLTLWRHAIAGFYDQSDCRPCLQSIDRIEIDCESPMEKPVQAYFLLGWLASSLDWQWTGDRKLRNAKQTPIAFEVQPHQGVEDRLLAVRLYSGSDAQFRISLAPETGYLHTEATLQGRHPAAEVIKIPQQPLSALISKELTILEHDVIYERSVRFIVGMI